MPPEPDLDTTQSADEDGNSDPFTDVHIDEDIDSAMKSWEGLMDKKHSKPKMKNVASGILSALQQTSNVFWSLCSHDVRKEEAPRSFHKQDVLRSLPSF